MDRTDVYDSLNDVARRYWRDGSAGFRRERKSGVAIRMAIPLSDRKKARDAATYHVQVELLDVPSGFTQRYGSLSIQGRVVRIFKGDSRLKMGDRVEFSVAIITDSECLVDGGRTLPYDELLRARYLEVCLNGVPPRCDTVIDLYDIVPEPTDSPRITLDVIETAPTHAARKWWQRRK